MANLYWPKLRLGTKSRRHRSRDQSWRKAAEQAGEALVLSHGHCLDGVTSAVIAMRVLKDVKVAYCQPSQVAHALDKIAAVPGGGRLLLVADLSLQPRDLPAIVAAVRKAREGGWRIQWLDHHHKQWEGLDLAPLEAELEVLKVDRRMKESGATLVQKALAPKDKFLRRLAETVRDRDLWWNKTPDSETLEFALTEMGTKEFTRHFVDHDGEGPVVDAAIEAAAGRERQRQQRDAARVLAGTMHFGAAPDRVAVVYGWLPKNTGLHTLLEDPTCAVAVNVRPNGKMSIRSRKGADVSHVVAGAFGGGGHPNASGGDLGLRGPAYWWYVARRGRVARSRQVAEAAVAALRGEGGQG